MTTRQAVAAAPGPLEAYAASFDALFAKTNQRHAFRQYLEGVLLPAERTKTLTALANTEPIIGAQNASAQSLQWFLSESTWDPDIVNTRRVDLRCAVPVTAPHAEGVLVIDEHGDRKWGHKTAHVGTQYLANLGKTENGVVSVTSLFADEQVYYPLHVKPGTLWVSQAHHFAKGKADPEFRTKLALALELVDAAVQATIPFRAVVADCFYGEDEAVKRGLRERGLGYVLALRPSHGWWQRKGDIGSLREAAGAVEWTDAASPGEWVRVIRRHWQLVCCVFSFCWYHQRHAAGETVQLVDGAEASAHCSSPTTDEGAGREINQRQPGVPTTHVVAGGTPSGEELAGALDHAVALLESLVHAASPAGVAAVA